MKLTPAFSILAAMSTCLACWGADPAFDPCRFAIGASSMPVNIIIAGEHHDADVALKKMVVDEANLGKLYAGLEAVPYGFDGPAQQALIDRDHRTKTPLILTITFNGEKGPIYGIEDDFTYMAVRAPIQFDDARQELQKVKLLADRGPAVLNLLRLQPGIVLPPQLQGLNFDLPNLLAHTPPFNLTRMGFLDKLQTRAGLAIWEHMRKTRRLSPAGEQVARTIDVFLKQADAKLAWESIDGVLEVFKQYALASTDVVEAYCAKNQIPYDAEVVRAFIADPNSNDKYLRLMNKIGLGTRNHSFGRNIGRVITLETPRFPGRGGVFVVGGGHVLGTEEILRRELDHLRNFRLQTTGRIIDPTLLFTRGPK